MLIQTSTFCIPEPILLQLTSIGNIETRTGQHLYPAFPILPTTSLSNRNGGYHGTFNLELPQQLAEGQEQIPAAFLEPDYYLHNLFEEIPCLGVTAEAIRASISDNQPGTYVSELTYGHQQPTANLIGFRPLAYRRPEAKNLAFDNGIGDDRFPDFPVNSAINFQFLMAISNALASTKTFKLTDVNFSTLSELGSISQVLLQRPLLTRVGAGLLPGVRSEILATSLTKESPTTFGMSIFFAPQLLKDNRGDDHSSWSLFPQIPLEWVRNRNSRRDLPPEYTSQIFSVTPEYSMPFRTNVVKALVKEKR